MPQGPIAPRPRLLGRVTAAVAASTAAVLSLTPPAQAAAAEPQNLQSTAVPVLSWDKATGAARYEVQVDNDLGFDTPEFTVKTTNTRTVPTKALSGGVQYWRVRSLDSSGASSPWSQAEFEVAAPDVPSGLSPDGAALPQPDEPPVLAWTGVQGATSYIVELDADPDFIGATPFSTKTTSLVWPLPLEAGDYWWRVTAAKGPGIVSLPSEAASFEILPLQPVVLTGPEDSPDTAVEDVVLDWDPVPGAKYYEVRVARDADFNTIVDSRSKVYGSRYSPPTTYNNAQYYWQVRAIDMADKPTPWTTVENSFSREWSDTPVAQWPLGPVDGPQSFQGEPYFQWSPVQHATVYQIQVGSDRHFSPGTFTECVTAGTTYSVGNFVGSSPRTHEGCGFPPGQVTYWRVRAFDQPFSSGSGTPGVQGIYSETQAVIWDDPFITGMSPQGESVDIPLLSWSGTREAESYTVTITNAETGLSQPTRVTNSQQYVPLGGSQLPAGDYYWEVSAKDSAKRTSLIHEGSFQLTGDLPASGAEPLTPLTGISTDPATIKAPLLSWEPDPAAAYYKVSIGSAASGTWFTHISGDVIGQAVAYPAVVDTSGRFFTPGDYIWRVDAYNQAGTKIGTGPIETFTTKPLDPVAGQSIAIQGSTLDEAAGCAAHLDPNGVSGPQCEGTPTSPVLSWEPVEGASSYMVYVSNDSSFTNLLEAQTPSTSGTRYALTEANTRLTYPDSQAGQSYYWFVRPCKATGKCGPNPVSTIGMATNAFRKLSVPVELLTPEEDVDVAAPNLDASEVTFTWVDYLDSAQGTTWAETGELDPEAGKQYRIQIDDNQTFSSTLEDVRVDQATYTSFTELYPEGQLNWRVQAIDADGNGLAWSEVRTFVKQSPAVALTFPVEDQVVSGTAAFRWEPQPFNSEYRIEVYKNDDATFSSANRVFFKDVSATAYSWDKPLPAAEQAYLWRVRGKDSVGNLMPWSTTGRFFSNGASPSLLEPADNTPQDANGPLFSWTSVAGAVTYQLEVRTAFATWLKVSTSATAFATVNPAPDGTLTWRVTAMDAGNNPLGTSAAYSFTVDGAVPRVIQKSPVVSPRLNANFVVTFSEPITGVKGTTFKLYQQGRSSKLAAVLKLNAARTKATLNPKSNLKPGKSYTVKLTSGIKDDAGNALVAYSWKVTTPR